MSLADQIAEAERMQRWDYAEHLRRQTAAEGAPVNAQAAPDNATAEGGDVNPEPADAPVEKEQD